MRKRIAASIAAVLVFGLSVSIHEGSASADPAPWTWVQKSASADADINQTVSVTCPSGYSAVTGGWAYGTSGLSIKDVTIEGGRYSVDAGDGGPLSVTAWCAKSSQVDIQIVHRTLTVSASGDHWRGYGDYACGGDMTPLDASLNWTKDPLYTLQSGPETIGGVNEWFVAARGRSSAASMDVRLLCVANSDLPNAQWLTESWKNSSGDAVTKSVSSSCPAQQRLLTGGEHIDSLVAPTYGSTPEDGQTWTTQASVPAGDILSVSVLCAPDGDPVATFTSVPHNPTNSSTATFTFDAVDPGGGTASNVCFVDSNYLGPCTDSYTVTGLPEGENHFSIEAVTDDGRGGTSTVVNYYFSVDVTPPTITLHKPPLFTLADSTTLHALGTDNQGIGYYSIVRIARRSSGTGAKAANPVTTSEDSTDGAVPLAVRPGMSYTVKARSVDQATNFSVGTAVVRTAAPIDNFDLAQSKHWTLVKGAAYTYRDVSRSTARGATLTHTMYGTTLGVVATTCPKCGQIGVYAGAKLLKKITLTSKHVRHRQIRTVTLGSTAVEKKITIKVLSSAKIVEIDGLGAVVG